MAQPTPKIRLIPQLVVLASMAGGILLGMEEFAGSAESIDSVKIDDFIQKAIKAWRVPGVAVGIVRDDQVVYLKGHGLRSLNGTDPVTPETTFPLASCSKAFTTAALAQMVEEGKIGWDDPVQKHLSYFRLADPLANRDVTLRDLLCHRTGLGHLDWIWYRTKWPEEERIKRIGLIPLERQFRTAFIYQSTMYTAAGLCAAHAGGETWPNLIRKRLFEPLKMERTVLTSTEAQDLEPASGHILNADGKVEPLPAFFMTHPDPAGSVHSSARDLCRWLTYQLKTPLLEETHRPQMVIPMNGFDRKKHPETVQLSYGLAWVIQDYRGIQLCSHAGLIDGFRIHICLVPRHRLGFVILNNLDRTEMNQALANSLLDWLLNLPRRDWNRYHLDLMLGREKQEKLEAEEREAKVDHGIQPTLPWSAYAGKYSHPVAGDLTVTAEGKTLKIKWEQLGLALQHYQKNTFQGHDPRGQVFTFQFELNASGQLTGVVVPEILPQPFLRK